MSGSHPVIVWGFEFSPYTQKIRSLLAVNDISFKSCEVENLLPRPALQKLGITFRRVPIMSIGKDFFCDTNLIVHVILHELANKVPTTKADRAWASLGDKLFFVDIGCIPMAFMSEEFINDRKEVFPMLARKDYADLRPSYLSDLKANLEIFESEYLNPGPYIEGDKMTMADLQIAWAVRWILKSGQAENEPGFSEKDLPKTYKWFESIPLPPLDKISGDDANKAVLDAQYKVTPQEQTIKDDPLGISLGTQVAIESQDTDSGVHPQKGKLIGLTSRTQTIELQNGVRMHFPREGYIIKKA